jgi:cytidylate kinase
MVGRDIGTNVLRDATLKIYLDVSVEQQARRRYREIIDNGGKAEYDDILAGLVRRDKIDSKRAVNPLKKADDAYLIDTDKLGIQEVLGEILKLMDKR